MADFGKAIARLQSALEQPKDEFVHDSAIQRFEFTFELFWNLLKEFALVNGLDLYSPAESIKAGFELRVIEDEELFLEMLKNRNLASHTYEEITAEEIFNQLGRYAHSMRRTVEMIGEKMSG